LLLPNLIKELTPIREKREKLIRKKHELEEIIQEGDKKAREVAQKTLEEVRKKLGLN
jgi:tryptophanyl-tRNA synthetase